MNLEEGSAMARLIINEITSNRIALLIWVLVVAAPNVGAMARGILHDVTLWFLLLYFGC